MKKYENIIIGAGPAGLQLGYFFEKNKINYIIIEKGENAGTFFSKYPHTENLISINKKYTGNDNEEFNLRHDWNSLLNDEKLLFTNYSEEYYPSNKDLVCYLNDFAINNKLNIVYNSHVIKVDKNESKYNLEVNENQKKIQYCCNKLIVATGLSKLIKPDFIYDVKTPILHYGEYPKNYFKKDENLQKFKNKSLLIFGNGNSAFELGNHLNKYCSTITILGRRHKPWAMSTHYTGDLRSIYMPLYDTFLLKSLNAIIWKTSIYKYIIEQENENDKYNIKNLCSPHCNIKHICPLEEGKDSNFDHIILCTGWGFDNSIFNFNISSSDNKYPTIKSNYESINNENLFFIGSLMHSLDYKKSSGGFIHGFRYLIKYFFDSNYLKQLDIIKISTIDILVDHILYNINISSPLYQMYGKLSDTFYIKNNEFIYYNAVPINFFRDIKHSPNRYYFVITLEYGNQPITNMIDLGQKISYLGFENKSPLLHPVIRIYQFHDESKRIIEIDEVHFDEDLYSEFTYNMRYKNKLLRTIKMFL
jgi:thioredoxin reductase